MQGNPWFWGGLTRQEFERNLVKEAVSLRDKNAKVVVKKVDIEDVRNRKNALAAKGVLVLSDEVKKRNMAHMTAGTIRAIK